MGSAFRFRGRRGPKSSPAVRHLVVSPCAQTSAHALKPCNRTTRRRAGLTGLTRRICGAWEGFVLAPGPSDPSHQTLTFAHFSAFLALKGG